MKPRVFFLCLVLALLLLAVFWYAFVVHYQGAYVLSSTQDEGYNTLLTKAFVTAYALATLTAEKGAAVPRRNIEVTQVVRENVKLGEE